LSGYATLGDFTSSTKDSNPAVTGTSTWETLSWNATVPANTTLKFQVAASNSQFGPFNFVGPGGTAATFFTIGSSLAQFNALRYLQYKAFFTSTDSTVTPTLNDVTICNTNPRVWTGAASSDWNNPSNWSSSGVPGSSDPAIIPSTGVLNNPLNTTSASVGSLMLGAGRIVTTGANSLTVTNCSTSAITGGNSTSYVKGTLIRCVNSAGPYTFPVGTGVGYAPVTLGGVVGSGTFLVSPVDGVLTGASPSQSIQRYWTITPSGPTQANITLSYQSSDVPGGANESAFQILHQNGSGTFGFAPTSFDVPTHTFVINGVTAFSNWSVGTPLAPTAANVSISGRVVNQGGLGVAGASLTLMDATGPSRAIRTNNFGYFTLDDIRVGRTYIASVRAKGYQFETRVISVTDDIANLDFVALP